MMNTTENAPARRNASIQTIVWSAALDVILVVVFAAVGRGSHAREATISGLLDTAWPFLLALALSWFASRAWQHPLSLLRAGLPIWIGTVTLGLLIRVCFTPATAALPFILVTVSALALCLLGWRLIVFLVYTRRGAHKGATAPDTLIE